MPALSYQKQFAPLVESGTKMQTIRKRRKRTFRSGDRLYHYTGMRTKVCRKLGESICSLAVDITIHMVGIDFEAMKTWFIENHGLPFEGQLIRWTKIKRRK